MQGADLEGQNYKDVVNSSVVLLGLSFALIQSFFAVHWFYSLKWECLPRAIVCWKLVADFFDCTEADS